MSSITPSYQSVKNELVRNIDFAKKVERNTNKTMNENKNATRNSDTAKKAYSDLSKDLTRIQSAKWHLLKTKKDLSTTYDARFAGKKQRIKDILKFCWGPKAKIRSEIRQLDSLQKTVERKMAKLDPEKFIERKHTIISKEKVEKKEIKDEIKLAKAKFKLLDKALNKFEAFAELRDPKTAVKHFHSFSPQERDILRDLNAYQQILSDVQRSMNPKKAETGMARLQREIKTNLPVFKSELAELKGEIKRMENELKIATERSKLGYDMIGG